MGQLKSKIIAAQRPQQGFTVIELLVVIAIMGTILGLVLANYNQERSTRNIKISQSEFLTNLRKIQGYALSSRTLNGTTPVQFYIMRVDTTTLSYQIQAIYDYYTGTPKLATLETVNFPQYISFAPATGNAATAGLVIDRPSTLSPSQALPTCALIAFQVPFGNILVNEGCAFNTSVPFNDTVPNPDHYRRILNHIVNTSGNSVSGDTNVTFLLRDSQTGNTKSILLKGVSGTITAQ